MKPGLLGALLIAGSIVASPASAQMQPPGIDTKGAVMCTWSIYELAVQYTRKCGWARNVTDEAIENGISAMDAFIIKNSSTPVTQQMLDQNKLNLAAQIPDDACAFDPNDLASFTAMVWTMRQVEAAAITKGVTELLSVPREPVMDPCL